MNQFDWMQTLGSDRHGDLGGIAAATGGFLVQDTNDLGSALDRVENDASEFYTLVYVPSNHNYDGAYRKIKVESTRRGYHVRYRQGYWALPPGREVMMTPAAAQLLATIQSGERKPSFAPQLAAVMVPVAGGFGVAAAVSMPGKLVPFEKQRGQYEAGVSVLLLARDENGRLLAVHEGYGNITLDPQDRDDFATKIFNWQGHVALQDPQPVTVQAIVRFPDGTIGMSAINRVPLAEGGPDLRLTGLVLADRAENSACTSSPTEPLCVLGERIRLVAQPKFPRSTMLEVYCGVLNATSGGGQNSPLRVTFRIGSGQELNPISPKELVAIPSGVAPYYAIRALFDLGKLEPGNYTLEMTAENKDRQGRAAQRAELTVQ
jgi:hypothetical protein